ncbi:MAG TPA: hypothetical protein PLD48_09815 [Bacillota bacterium]|nr:hypothetical protein [Bacillota bacterium]HPP86006.1 hypothetical protein [Bacillota bacterium]
MGLIQNVKDAVGVLTGKNQVLRDESAPAEKFTRDSPAGMAGKIDKYQVLKAAEILQKYKQYKKNAEYRVRDNTLYINARQWQSETYKKHFANEPDPTSSWLFNGVANKHADFMDNFPEISVLPREPDDQEKAELLSSILPVVLENAKFEKAYDQVGWDVQTGIGIFGVFWNPTLYNGLGDIEIKAIDVMSLFWEPGVTDIQDSRHVFRVELVDNEILEVRYPQVKGHLGSDPSIIEQYLTEDDIPNEGKSLVYHWYYKVQKGTKTILHYCQFVNDIVLFASENAVNPDGTPTYPDGYYWHGKYPFVTVHMYPAKGSLIGYGTVDIGRNVQRDIDLLNKAMIQNARLASIPRFAYKKDAGVNMDEFFDFTKPGIQFEGSGTIADAVMPVNVQPLEGTTLSYHTNRIQELKEVIGNRDFSQGGTTGGVTAASAIAVLIETGSKLSRATLQRLYSAVKEVGEMCIELIRQFYTIPRQFRIIGSDGSYKFQQFSGQDLQAVTYNELGTDPTVRVPIFDVKVRIHKGNPYNKYAHNQEMMQLYQLGFFNPQLAPQALACLKGMDIEGKDELIKTISENNMQYQQLQAVIAENIQLKQLAAKLTGDNRFITSQGAQNDNNNA